MEKEDALKNGEYTGHDYKELNTWQAAMDLVTKIYGLTKCFPKDEVFGLTSQIRRSAVSIPSNIAEGKGRYSNPDIIHFLVVARGSLNELETQLILSERIGYLNSKDLDETISDLENCKRLLSGLIRYHKNLK